MDAKEKSIRNQFARQRKEHKTRLKAEKIKYVRERVILPTSTLSVLVNMIERNIA